MYHKLLGRKGSRESTLSRHSVNFKPHSHHPRAKNDAWQYNISLFGLLSGTAAWVDFLDLDLFLLASICNLYLQIQVGFYSKFFWKSTQPYWSMFFKFPHTGGRRILTTQLNTRPQYSGGQTLSHPFGFFSAFVQASSCGDRKKWSGIVWVSKYSWFPSIFARSITVSFLYLVVLWYSKGALRFQFFLCSSWVSRCAFQILEKLF